MKQILLLFVFIVACSVPIEQISITNPTSSASDGCGNVLPVNGECPAGCVDYGVPKHCVPEDYDCNEWGDCELGSEPAPVPQDCGQPDSLGNCPEGCWDFGSPLGCVSDDYNPDIQ